MAFTRLVHGSLLILLFFCLSSHAASDIFGTTTSDDGRADGLVPWRRSVAETASPGDMVVDNSTFILASERTYRRDPLNDSKRYTGGWNISDKHYWASVGYSAAPLFVIALVWFLGFGLVLFLICCCYCCCPRRSYSYSRIAYALSLILLILFTCAAILGCVYLYTGQGKFHRSTSSTLTYVVSQANITVENLRNLSDILTSAKKVGVDQIFLPSDVLAKIDEVNSKINSSASGLATRTSDNSQKISDVLDSVQLALIIVSVVMLLLAFLGFFFSVLGMQFLVYFLVLIGWVLVAATFVLCGVFLIFHNAVEDTCVAMNDWVAHPHAHTALDDILPCVDVATANETLQRTKEVTYQLVNVVDQVITNISNRNFPPIAGPLYYNQSGPLMPVLCNPYKSDLSNRTCLRGEVDLNNASQVWRNYVCNASAASGSEICTSVGRVTPSIYGQMTAAVSVSYGLYHYGPFLVQLEDCTFVRETFQSIYQNNCPGLGRYTKWIYVGMAMISAAVMLSLIFWVLYARERRHRKRNKQFMARPGHTPIPEKPY